MTTNPRSRRGNEGAMTRLRIVGGPPPDGWWKCATCEALVKIVVKNDEGKCPLCQQVIRVEAI